VKSVAKEFGRLDILVNNAGVFAGGAVNDSSADLSALERLFAVNVGGVTAAVRAAVPFLRQGGRIITIGSVAVKHSEHIEIALESCCRLFTVDLRQLRSHPLYGALKHGESHSVLGIKMVVQSSSMNVPTACTSPMTKWRVTCFLTATRTLLPSPES